MRGMEEREKRGIKSDRDGERCLRNGGEREIHIGK